MAEVKRSVRIGERVREVLSGLLLREVRDPRVNTLIISEVEMTSDLQLAKVRFRLPTGDEPATRKAALAGLESASGMLRREVGKRLALRYAPRFAFFYDENPERRDRIDEILNEIAREPRPPAKDDEES